MYNWNTADLVDVLTGDFNLPREYFFAVARLWKNGKLSNTGAKNFLYALLQKHCDPALASLPLTMETSLGDLKVRLDGGMSLHDFEDAMTLFEAGLLTPAQLRTELFG